MHAPAGGQPISLTKLLDGALAQPVAAPLLEDAVHPRDRVVIAVSDTTRDEPRDAMLRALLARLPDDIQLSIAIANGTHGPCRIEQLGIGADLWARATIINHNAQDDRHLVSVGKTQRGTPVRIHRCVVESDWLIATGRIKPHYFAGYGAGCKAIFPGLGGNREIRINHQLKTQPGSRSGVVDGNPCRDDLEEAVAMLPGQKFLLNVVFDSQDCPQAAVAGDMFQAFRAGATLCAPFYSVTSPRTELIIVSDNLPMTGSLYQASKLVAAAAELLEDGGTIVIAADCPEGVGPVDTVNKAIYEIGLAPRLPSRHRIVLVSSLKPEQVAPSYCEWAPTIESVLADLYPAPRNVEATIIPQAGALIIKPKGLEQKIL
ncbi:MAG: lactate racemase domain-containing protein [Proteobacteria bacterium]|nr:lactate racemase domain-containing protein [Pseudomonadota bacterium]